MNSVTAFDNLLKILLLFSGLLVLFAAGQSLEGCSTIEKNFAESNSSACRCYTNLPDFDFDFDKEEILAPSRQKIKDQWPENATLLATVPPSKIWIGCTEAKMDEIYDLLTSIPAETRLSKLWIWNNYLPRILTMFASLKTDKLIIERNRVDNLNNFRTAVKNMAADLRHLILRNNEISNVASSFLDLVNLRTLDLSYNQIVEIELALINENAQSELRYLSFERNAIRTVKGKPFINMPHLENLNLAGNKLKSLDDDSSAAFEGLAGLKVLHLENNEIDSFSGHIFEHLPNLNTLKLSGNRLKVFGSFKKPLLALKQLDLANNQLTNLISIEAPEMQVLNLDENHIAEIVDTTKGLLSLKNLKVLSLSFNRIESIKSAAPFATLTRLVTLILHGNALQTFPKDLFKQMSSLRELILSNNKIAALSKDTFDGVSKLAVLNLAGNQLAWPMDGQIFANFDSIDRLYLNRNKLKFVDRQFLNNLSKVKLVNLEGNPWQCVCELLDLSTWMQEHATAVVGANWTTCTSELGFGTTVQHWPLTLEVTKLCPAAIVADHGPDRVHRVDDSGGSTWITALAFVLGISSVLTLLAVAYLLLVDDARKHKLRRLGVGAGSLDSSLDTSALFRRALLTAEADTARSTVAPTAPLIDSSTGL